VSHNQPAIVTTTMPTTLAEEGPLLPHLFLHEEDASDRLGGEKLLNDLPATKYSKLSKAIIWCLILEFMLEMSDSILTVPLISHFERSICLQYYDRQNATLDLAQGVVVESDCKIQLIQSELARIRGWKAFFDTLVGEETNASWRILCLIICTSTFAVSISRLNRRPGQPPRGLLCNTHRNDGWFDLDRFHKYCLIYSLLHLVWSRLICVVSHPNLPLRLMWLSLVFYLCSVGNYAAEMMMGVIIADQCTESDR
jgi:hypothetical protein